MESETRDDKDFVVPDRDLKPQEPEARERRNPGATLGLVMGAYPLALLLALVVALLYYAMSRDSNAEPSLDAPPTGSTSSVTTGGAK